MLKKIQWEEWWTVSLQIAQVKLCLQFWRKIQRKFQRAMTKPLTRKKRWKLGAAVGITRTVLLFSISDHVNKFDVQHLAVRCWKNGRKQRKSDKISCTYLSYDFALELDSNTACCSNDLFIKRQAKTAVSGDLCWPLLSLSNIYPEKGNNSRHNQVRSIISRAFCAVLSDNVRSVDKSKKVKCHKKHQPCLL